MTRVHLKMIFAGVFVHTSSAKLTNGVDFCLAVCRLDSSCDREKQSRCSHSPGGFNVCENYYQLPGIDGYAYSMEEVIGAHTLSCEAAKLYVQGPEESCAVLGWESGLEERSSCVDRPDQSERVCTAISRAMNGEVVAGVHGSAVTCVEAQEIVDAAAIKVETIPSGPPRAIGAFEFRKDADGWEIVERERRLMKRDIRKHLLVRKTEVLEEYSAGPRLSYQEAKDKLYANPVAYEKDETAIVNDASRFLGGPHKLQPRIELIARIFAVRNAHRLGQEVGYAQGMTDVVGALIQSEEADNHNEKVFNRMAIIAEQVNPHAFSFRGQELVDETNRIAFALAELAPDWITLLREYDVNLVALLGRPITIVYAGDIFPPFAVNRVLKHILATGQDARLAYFALHIAIFQEIQPLTDMSKSAMASAIITYYTDQLQHIGWSPDSVTRVVHRLFHLLTTEREVLLEATRLTYIRTL